MGLDRRGWRRWIAASLALAAALGVAAPRAGRAAEAVHADAAAAEQDGYGRITLRFEALPHFSVEAKNDILIARFDHPVDVDVGPIAEGLPHFVALGRRDPDHMALRFSLSQDVTVKTLQGGDTLFIDLLPRGWVGMPPGLPAKTLADMNRRLQDESAAIRAARTRAAAGLKPLVLRAGSRAGMIRLVFAVGDHLAASFTRDGDDARVSVPAPVPFDLAAARAALPPTITGLRSAIVADRRVVSFVVPPGWSSAAEHDDGDLVVALRAAPPRTAPAARGSTLRVAPASQTDELAPPSAVTSHDDPRTTGSIAPAVPRSSHGAAEGAAPAPQGLRPEVRRDGEGAELSFPFAALPAAALFRRGRYLWLLFDSPTAVDGRDLAAASGGLVAEARTVAADPGQALLLRLGGTAPVGVAVRDGRWVLTIGGSAAAPAATPLSLVPGTAADGRAMISARLGAAGGLHWVTDPIVGDRIAVVTLPPPLRGATAGRAFVDFEALATLQGLALRTDADDLSVGLAAGTLTVTRRNGLTLSPHAAGGEEIADVAMGTGVFDRAEWQALRAKPFYDGAQDLMRRAAMASAAERPAAFLDLARFQLAHDNAADTLGALALARVAKPQLAHDTDALLLEGAALVELRRFDDARRLLASPPLAAAAEAALWRGTAEAQLGEIAAARRSFREGAPILRALPDAMQRRFRLAEAEVALTMHDYDAAGAALDAADAVADGAEPFRRDLLRGRLAQGLGQPGAALDAYRAAIAGNDPIATASATLRATRLRYDRRQIDLAAATDAAEGLAVMWRGDDVEAATLAFLAHLYGEARRWRAAFTTLRTAVAVYPNAASTRDAQDEMAENFARLYLDEGPNAAPETLASLALFYDFREMIPTGRRGDEMIRRLADRLVRVDLLDQAGDLLDYQIEHRLQGIARATVAARAALVHLLDHQPQRAFTVLQKTRIAGLPADIEASRLTMEARATADLGRPELALELVAGLDGPDIRRLRADILWEARRWQPAAEALELLVQDVAKGTAPLDATARIDVLRAATAYALAGDPLGLDRLRSAFAARMGNGGDSAAFDAVTAPVPTGSRALQDVARAVSQADSLSAFVKAYRAQHPNEAVPAPDTAAAG